MVFRIYNRISIQNATDLNERQSLGNNYISKSMIRHRKVNAYRLSKPDIQDCDIETHLPSKPITRPWLCKRTNITNDFIGVNDPSGRALGELEVQNNGVFNHDVKFGKEKAMSICSGGNYYLSVSKPNGKENLYGKISQFLRKEECSLVKLPITKTNSRPQRPQTSLNTPRYTENASNSITQGTTMHVRRSSVPTESERMSTSRALMNHSKVYRRGSHQQYKVKKNRSLKASRLGSIAASRVVFQEKEKPERRQVKSEWARRRRSKQPQLSHASRDEDDFELIGWEHCEDQY